MVAVGLFSHLFNHEWVLLSLASALLGYGWCGSFLVRLTGCRCEFSGSPCREAFFRIDPHISEWLLLSPSSNLLIRNYLHVCAFPYCVCPATISAKLPGSKKCRQIQCCKGCVHLAEPKESLLDVLIDFVCVNIILYVRPVCIELICPPPLECGDIYPSSSHLRMSFRRFDFR